MRCRMRIVPNVRMGNVSLDCFGLECSECGWQTMYLDVPERCPQCGREVVMEYPDPMRREGDVHAEKHVTGDGTTHWLMCSECHGDVEPGDSYCRHCGAGFR